MRKSSIIYIGAGVIITAVILAWKLIPLLTTPPIPEVTWSEEAQEYPLADIYLEAGVPTRAIPTVVGDVRDRAERYAAERDLVVDVDDLREAIAFGFHERHPDKYPTMEDAYARLEELEAMVGYTPP